MQNRKRDTDVQNRLLDSVGEGKGGMFQENSIGARFGSTYTKIGMIQRRLAWPLRKDDTQIREAFHIFGMGNTCRSMANSCQCMTKTTTIL